MARTAMLVLRLAVIVLAFIAALAAGGLMFTLSATVSGEISANAGTAIAEYGFAFAIFSMLVAASAGYIVVVPVTLLIGVSEYFGLRSFTLHLTLGAATGLAAVLVSESGRSEPATAVLLAGTAAGIAGSFVYWLIAGRNAGRTFDAVVSGPGRPES